MSATVSVEATDTDTLVPMLATGVLGVTRRTEPEVDVSAERLRERGSLPSLVISKDRLDTPVGIVAMEMVTWPLRSAYEPRLSSVL